MAEDTFTDRIQRSTLLLNTISGLTPAYHAEEPEDGDPDLRPSGFQTCINLANTANDEAEDQRQDYSLEAKRREDLLDEILKSATSVLAYLRGKPALSSILRHAEKIVDRMRGTREKQPDPPAEPGTPEPVKRNRGQQSYAEQAQHLRTLIRLLTGKPGYNPTSAPGQPQHPASTGALSGQLSSLRSFNAGLSDKEADVMLAEAKRQDAFEDEKTGLHTHFLAMKSHAQSQYAFGSTNYQTLHGIEW